VQVLRRTVALTAFADATGELLARCEHVVPQRQFSPGELALLAEAAGFDVVALHGDFDASCSLSDEGAFRMVACLRRREGN
jgi:hypothetical protein